MDDGLQIPKNKRQGIHLLIVSVVVAIVGFLIALSGFDTLGKIIFSIATITGFIGFFWQLGTFLSLKRK